MNSILLTIHNKEGLIVEVLDGIFKNAVEKFELIICLDGCTDKSEEIVLQYLYNSRCKNLVHFNVLRADNVFETRANNMCARASRGEYVIIIQDDCKILEYGFDERLLRPMRTWSDIFAVTGNCAHNWYFNENSKDIHTEPHGRDWADILMHKDYANRTTVKRDKFAIRDSCNRGPLAINRKDFETLGYFSEEIVKQDLDDHILMNDAFVKLGK
jgi:glycosyltransferase involved in cell wall biosynthesis